LWYEDRVSSARRVTRPARALLCAALVLAACGSGPEDESGRRGGTLRVVDADGVTHLDPAAAHDPSSYALARAFARQLVTYPADPEPRRATRLVADAATQVPTVANRRISRDGLRYRFTVRDGVRWDTDPPRQVTSYDFIRGLERLCNPVAPVGEPGYLTATIAGFGEFCAGLRTVEPAPEAIRNYLEFTDIAGVTALDDRTFEVTLTRPTSDFLNILALPAASAAPDEYLDQMPDGPAFRRQTISNGPYSIVRYEPGRRIVLARNPAWRPEADPVRAAWVDRIEVTLGGTAESIHRRLEAGVADLAWDAPVPAARIASLFGDERLELHDTGTVGPYLQLNTGADGDRALRKPAVRRALHYAVDRVAVAWAYGGPRLATPLGQVLPPTVSGHRPYDPYPVPGHRGDPEAARRLLTGAGHPRGLPLTMIHGAGGAEPAAARAVRTALARAGIAVTLVPARQADSTDPVDPADPMGPAGPARWDLALRTRVPDWAGDTARTLFQPLLAGAGTAGAGTAGACVDRALAAADAGAAAPIWHECDRLVMADASFLPLLNPRLATFRAGRVRNVIHLPYAATGDITHAWLVSG
jgi:peptide/nickel transport system substrate-binding protein